MAANQDVYKKAMNAGHSAAWDQEWQKAAGFYSAALDEYPDNPQALSSLGLAYFEMQDFAKSLICYQHAARVAPKDPVPQEKMARIFERMDQYNEAAQASLKAAELHLNARDVEKAIDNWRRVLSLFPEHLATRQRLAAVFERMGRRSEAVVEYLATASIIQRSGDLTRALKTVEYAAKLMPESQDARFALHTLRSSQLLPRPSRPKATTGMLRQTAVKESEKEAAEAARQVDPVEETRQKAMVHLAGLLFEGGDEPGGAETAGRRGINMISRGNNGPLGAANADKARVVLHLGQAIESISQGDEGQAAKELEKALELGLRQPSAFFLLALLIRGRDADRALRYLQDAQQNPDYGLGAYLLCGQLYRESGKLPEAAAAYLQALAIADSEIVDPRYGDELRQSYEPMIDALGNETNEAALQNICGTVSSQLSRQDWRAFLQLARSQLPPQTAGLPLLPVAEMILESHGAQVVEAVARVRLLAQRGLIDTAMEEAFFALQYAPTYLPIHVQIGELLLQNNHSDEAVRKFMTIAELYYARGEAGRAARMFKRILQISPMDLVVHERLIGLLIGQDKVEEALEEYMELADIYYRLAELEKSRQSYMTALKVAQQSKKSRTWGVEILLKVADIDMQRLNLRQAVRIYEQIRAIQPEDSAVRLQLVLLNFRLAQDAAGMQEVDSFIALLESAGRRKQAVDFINDLLVEQGGNLDLRRRLADLYVKEGRGTEAVAQLDAVAEAYLDAGKTLEAINMMETIIALRPANIDDYRSALEELRKSSLRK